MVKNQKGVTLAELFIVIVILGVVASVSIIFVGNIVENTRINADQATVKTLNASTRYFRLNTQHEDPFSNPTKTCNQLLNYLVDNGFIDSYPNPQSKQSEFIWDFAMQSWFLKVDENYLALSPYGNTFEEIVPNLINDIAHFHAINGHYARNWGDYRFTDLGLDPSDWEDPILNIYYRPSGSNLLLTPAEGYEFSLYNEAGEHFLLRSTHNWNLIYNHENDTWYYHSIEEANVIDITTLVVQRS